MASWSLSRARRSASCTVRTSVLLKSMMTTSSPRTSTRSHRPRSSVDHGEAEFPLHQGGDGAALFLVLEEPLQGLSALLPAPVLVVAAQEPLVDPRALEGGQELLQGHGLAPRLPAVVLLHRFVDGRPVHHAVVP